ncbi:UNVERIFIED_ORG: hypothetical protein ABIB52_004541 [Arthrobacter sp. UYCu721]
MPHGFKDLILRGNVIELAVAHSQPLHVHGSGGN